MHATLELTKLSKTFKAPPLEYNNNGRPRVTISIFKAKGDNKGYFIPFSSLAEAVGYIGAVGIDGAAYLSKVIKTADCSVYICKNKRYIDVNGVPVLLNAFIEIAREKTKLTQTWCKGENAKCFLEWYIETILPRYGQTKDVHASPIVEGISDIEDTINKNTERIEKGGARMKYPEAEHLVHKLELQAALLNLEADCYLFKAQDLQQKAAANRKQADELKDKINQIWEECE